MELTALTAYGRTSLLAILRRRLTLAVMLALPLALYLASHDAVGRSVRALTFGLSWALSTVAFFAAGSAREIEPRLALAGWRPRALLVTRLAGLTLFALGLAALLCIVVAVDQPVRSAAAVAVTFALTAVVAVVFGTAVGTFVTGELEGALVLFFFAGLQAVANPVDDFTRVLPFWSSRELATWAVDGAGVGSLSSGLTHALVTLVVCAGVTLAVGTPRSPRSGRRRRTDTRDPASG
jgi:hypothetical protein